MSKKDPYKKNVRDKILWISILNDVIISVEEPKGTSLGNRHQ
jgi:hypothetical protein